jgi:hypothetical protein
MIAPCLAQCLLDVYSGTGRRTTRARETLSIDASSDRWVDNATRDYAQGVPGVQQGGFNAKKEGLRIVSFSPVPQICVVADYVLRPTPICRKITKGQ